MAAGSGRQIRINTKPADEGGLVASAARATRRASVCAGSLPECIRDCIDDLMKQSPAQQLEEMHATLIRALASLENHDAMETHRLLAVLRGMVEGALAEAQHGRWWR
jgi:hypothetical protein